MKRHRRFSAELNEMVDTPQGPRRLHIALLDPNYRARLVPRTPPRWPLDPQILKTIRDSAEGKLIWPKYV